MQLKLTIRGNRITLPIATSYTVHGLIYNALRCDSSYSQQLHEEGNIADNRKFKLFSFSELQGKYEINGKSIIYPSTVSFEIRSTDAYMIQLLYTYFIRNKSIRLGNNDAEVVSAVLEDKTVFSEDITVRTLSPITVYSTDDAGHTRYYSPTEAAFYTAIVSNAKRKWTACGGSPEDFVFSIMPTENIKYVKRATSFKKTLIAAWHGEFRLCGSPQILNFLYHTGLGTKNSQGFGMFEISSRI